MKAKDRITALVCTNATGTQKLPMAIISIAKQPRCSKIRGAAVLYFHQENAWAETSTFRAWFYSVFLPFSRKTTSRSVALVMGNCGSHGDDLKDSLMKVHIFTLPPNCMQFGGNVKIWSEVHFTTSTNGHGNYCGLESAVQEQTSPRYDNDIRDARGRKEEGHF